METLEESKSRSSSGPLETVTVIYTENEMPKPDFEWYSTSTSYSSDISNSTESLVTLPDLNEVNFMKNMENNVGYVPVKCSTSISKGPKMQALDYFKAHNIFPLFTFLMTHLLANSPEDPIPFLVSLVDRCLKYRDQDADPPLLFEDSHVRSVYTALDPMDDGTIDFKQYVNGMITLGLAHFNETPEALVGKNIIVPKEVFIREAKLGLLKQLDILVGKVKRKESTSSLKSDPLQLSRESLVTSLKENIERKTSSEITVKSTTTNPKEVVTIFRSPIHQNKLINL